MSKQNLRLLVSTLVLIIFWFFLKSFIFLFPSEIPENDISQETNVSFKQLPFSCVNSGGLLCKKYYVCEGEVINSSEKERCCIGTCEIPYGERCKQNILNSEEIDGCHFLSDTIKNDIRWEGEVVFIEGEKIYVDDYDFYKGFLNNDYGYVVLPGELLGGNLIRIGRIINDSSPINNGTLVFIDHYSNNKLPYVYLDKNMIELVINNLKYSLFYHDDVTVKNDEYVIFDFPQTKGDKKINLCHCLSK